MNFRFSNLLGAPYRGGNVLIAGKSTLLTAVGNRVAVVDLVKSESSVLPFEIRRNVAKLALSPNGVLLLAVDDEGRAVLSNLPRKVVLHHISFKGVVSAVQFSPDGRLLAVAVGKQLQVWRAPGVAKTFAPFQLVHTFTGAHDTLTSIAWAPDSSAILAGCRDLAVRVYYLARDPSLGYRPATLTGHRDIPVGVFWNVNKSNEVEGAYSVSRDGALFKWGLQKGTSAAPAANGTPGVAVARGSLRGEDSEDEARAVEEPKWAARKGQGSTRGIWSLEGKHFFSQSARVSSVDYHAGLNLLVVGFSSGVFGLYQLPDFSTIHLLSISSQRITTATFNASGEWLAFGAAKLGQLLVWEWRSESYVLKQQGHYYDTNAVAFSPDAQLIATGADDSKLKIWNAASGFCFVTFSEHSMPVTGVAFAPSGGVVLSASLDGTVRAFDMIRYRNFRTFTSPEPTQFASLAVDASGEVVCAGTLDTFQVYVWSMKTGRLLDVLSGHEGPVHGLAFSPSLAVLASSSWDATVRLWDVFEGQGGVEILKHSHDVLALSYRPDGKQLATSTLDGNLYLWDPLEAILTGTIEGRRDIAGGRLSTDRRTSANSAAGKSFRSLAYSADGSYLLAGGNSKYVCMYDVAEKVLLKRFQLSHSRALDGVLDFLNSKKMTDAGPLELLEASDEDEEELLLTKHSTPGGDLPGTPKYKVGPPIRTKCLRMAPTGQAWAAATTEGVLVYSLDLGLVFDPADLDMDVTPEAVGKALKSQEWSRGVILALRLSEPGVIRKAVEAVPAVEVRTVVRSLPARHLPALVTALAEYLGSSPHTEFLLTWCQELCEAHGTALQASGGSVLPALRAIQKALGQLHEDLAACASSNQYLLSFLCSAKKQRT